MNTKKNKSAKLIALLLVLMLIIGGAVGGTLAWLIAETNPVTNTFTVGNITLALEETPNAKADGSTTNDIWQGKMVPGTELAKDPHVIVESGSEKCWVFVKVEEIGSATVGSKTYGFDNFVEYTMDEDWVLVETTENYVVYGYKSVIDAAEGTVTEYVLKGDETHPHGCVKIPSTVTKEMMDAVANGTAPKLTFTAYAIQSENLTKNDEAVTTAADAWSLINTTP